MQLPHKEIIKVELSIRPKRDCCMKVPRSKAVSFSYVLNFGQWDRQWSTSTSLHVNGALECSLNISVLLAAITKMMSALVTTLPIRKKAWALMVGDSCAHAHVGVSK